MRFWLTIIKVNLISLFLVYLPAFAASNPFKPVDDKTKQLNGYLTELSVGFATLVIIIAGLAAMFNKLRRETAMQIMGGAIIIGAAGSIAAWALS